MSCFEKIKIKNLVFWFFRLTKYKLFKKKPAYMLNDNFINYNKQLKNIAMSKHCWSVGLLIRHECMIAI